jgi:hypothetical protein
MFSVPIRRSLSICILTLTACGGSHLPVSLPETGATLVGTVKYAGEDVQYALVIVQAADGSTSAGLIGEDGVYHVPNAPLGEVRIGVNSSAARGGYQTAVMRGGAMSGGADGKSGRKKVNLKFIDVPTKYLEPQASGISTTVAAGENKYDIVITK